MKKSKSRRNDLILDREERIYRKFIKYKKNLFCKNIHDKLRSLKSKNPKEYWNILKFSKSKKAHSLNINNMYEHFKELNENINSDLHNFEPNDIMVNNNNEINSDFTLEEVEILVNKLKNNKATGLDNIINEFIRFSPIEVRLALVSLFNIILNSGIVPTDWCISLIQPLYKNKGSREDANNYRGISLISSIGKLFTALINQRLDDCVENNHILGEEQAGFRSGFSTTDHIFVLNSLIGIYLNKFNNKKRLFCAFVDY